MKVLVTIALRDFVGVFMMGAGPVEIPGEARGVRHAELPTQIEHNTGRHIRGIHQKRPQKAYSTELQGKAQTIRRAPTLSNQCLLGIVEMKKACQLGW